MLFSISLLARRGTEGDSALRRVLLQVSSRGTGPSQVIHPTSGAARVVDAERMAVSISSALATPFCSASGAWYSSIATVRHQQPG